MHPSAAEPRTPALPAGEKAGRLVPEQGSAAVYMRAVNEAIARLVAPAELPHAPPLPQEGRSVGLSSTLSPLSAPKNRRPLPNDVDGDNTVPNRPSRLSQVKLEQAIKEEMDRQGRLPRLADPLNERRRNGGAPTDFGRRYMSGPDRGDGIRARDPLTPISQALNMTRAVRDLPNTGDKASYRFRLTIQEGEQNSPARRLGDEATFRVRLSRDSWGLVNAAITDAHGSEIHLSYDPLDKSLQVGDANLSGPSQGQGLYPQIIAAAAAHGVESISSVINNGPTDAAIKQFQRTHPATDIPHSYLKAKTPLGAARPSGFLLSRFIGKPHDELHARRVAAEIAALLDEAAAMERAVDWNLDKADSLIANLTHVAKLFKHTDPELYKSLHLQISYLELRARPAQAAAAVEPATYKAR